MLPFFKPKKGFVFAGGGLETSSGGGGGGSGGGFPVPDGYTLKLAKLENINLRDSFTDITTDIPSDAMICLAFNHNYQVSNMNYYGNCEMYNHYGTWSIKCNSSVSVGYSDVYVYYLERSENT